MGLGPCAPKPCVDTLSSLTRFPVHALNSTMRRIMGPSKVVSTSALPGAICNCDYNYLTIIVRAILGKALIRSPMIP